MCALTIDGVAYCWGSNNNGQLGNGTTAIARLIPTAVVRGLKFQSISVGEHNACCVTHEVKAYCWGLNTYGAIGDGTLGLRAAPIATAGGLASSSISAANDYTCALTQAVDACCWGHDVHGEVGDGTTTQRNTPVEVLGGLHFVQIGAGLEHFCGVANDGSVYCWGNNESGALGDGTFAHRSVPTHLVGDPARPFIFQTVATGAGHACGVTQVTGSTNDVYCWGKNATGELGDGTTTASAGPFEVF